MASIHNLAGVEKLAEENYELWKVHMKSILIINDLWPFVDGTEKKPAENANEWVKKDMKALALINMNITQSQLHHVKKATTAKEAWDKLEAIFESKGPIRKVTLYKELVRMTKQPNVAVTQYVGEFEQKAEQLEAAGIALPNDLLSVMLLASLPQEYENFSVAVESRDEIPSLEYLKAKLKEEEARQYDRDSRKQHDGNDEKIEALTSTNNVRRNRTRTFPRDKPTKHNNVKFSGNCFNCGKTGHMSRFCKSKTKERNSADAMTAIAYNVGGLTPDTWCLDSGATKHMSNSKNKFHTLNQGIRTDVYTAADQCIKSNGEGNVRMKVQITRHHSNTVELKNVMYVPELRHNLISVPTITDNGYVVKFGQKGACVKRADGTTALTAVKRGQLYIVNQSDNYAMHINSESDNLLRWHQRFGHLNVRDLRKLKSCNMVEGMNLRSNVNNVDCQVCDKGKICQQPFKSSNSKSTVKLGLVHSDICGPMRTESLGGAKYFVTFIDDHTRYTETKMLRNKSDVLEAFRKYKRQVEKQTGCAIKCLRTDNGREYLSREFSKYLEEEGIKRQLSIEYTPQQNGVAERANRTLVEMARCIMIQGNLPQSLWAEAINAATYIRNRCPTKILNDKTPLEAWSGMKPYVGFFRIIGSKCVALNKSRRLGKFEPKGEEYILVGYDNVSKAYRLWKPNTKSVIRARDVKFIETTEAKTSLAKEIEDPTLTLHYGNDERSHENIEVEAEIESSDDENEDATQSGREYTSDTPSKQQDVVRSRGRPKLLRSGTKGRPRKIYHIKKTSIDPIDVEEAMNREDSEK
ncbi:Retrovirus-related Pol polyprotein from transposon TNT 1-94 [Anthophora quadrimaculata]